MLYVVMISNTHINNKIRAFVYLFINASFPECCLPPSFSPRAGMSQVCFTVEPPRRSGRRRLGARGSHATRSGPRSRVMSRPHPLEFARCLLPLPALSSLEGGHCAQPTLGSIFTSYLEFLCMGWSTLPTLFIPSCVYICVDWWVFLSCSGLWPNTTLFCCSNCPSFDHWGLLQLAPGSLWPAASLPSDIVRSSRLLLYNSCCSQS